MTIAKRFNHTALLMCPPEHYSIDAPDEKHGHANAFANVGYQEYSKDPKGFRAEAIRQWNNVRRAFEDAGAEIILLQPVEKSPDMVFTADPTLSFAGLTILSKFSNEPRQIEVESSHLAIRTMNPNGTIIVPETRIEGTGDNIYDPYRGVWWSGYTPNPGRHNAANGRSDIKSHELLEQVTGQRVISMPVKGPFFHIDTAMAPLPTGHIVCYKDGMQPEAYQKILDELKRDGLPPEKYLIHVSEEDAFKYACNLRAVHDTAVMTKCSEELQETVRTRTGMKVVSVDMSHFIHAGGGPHCVSNNVAEGLTAKDFAAFMANRKPGGFTLG